MADEAVLKKAQKNLVKNGCKKYGVSELDS
jgi:hypothetical protein